MSALLSAAVLRPELMARVVGGLGNQLFIYAAARQLAITSRAELILDVDFFRSDRRYGRHYRLGALRIAPHALRRHTWLPPAFDRHRLRAEHMAGRFGLLPGWDAIIERTPNVFQPEVLDARVRRRTRFDGYWQDERYFADLREPLLHELQPVAAVGERNRAFSEELRGNDWIGIHCRRQHAVLADGTPVAVRGRPVLPESYYVRALELLRVSGPLTGVVLFGDQPLWLLECIPASLPAVVVDWNDQPGGEVLDLWLMTRCRRMVISNSTLSWWGGWIGDAAGRQVVAPQPKDLAYWVRSAAGWMEVDW